MNWSELQGSVVIVTGGAHGIGREIAGAFAAQGASVAIVDRDGGAAAQAVTEITRDAGGQHLALTADVRDARSVTAAVDQVTGKLERIDILVNNAGIYPNTPVVEMAEEEWDNVFDVNVKGMFLMSQAVGRKMIADGRGGRIINISSGAAESGRVGAAHYCASKAAVNMFTRVLALELAPNGIVVNAVGPGLIEVQGANLNPEYVEEMVASTPMARIGRPADVAQAVLYLASPSATYITGTTLYVDGGGLAGRSLPLSG